MAKKKDLVSTLKTERYLVWAIVVAVTVAVGLMGRISLSNAESDAQTSEGQNLNHDLQDKTPTKRK